MSRPKPPKIKWKACGEESKDREGYCLGHRIHLYYSWLRTTPEDERYEVRFCGDVMGRRGDVDTAKKFVADNIPEWIRARMEHEEVQKAKQAEDARTGRELMERATAAAQALRELGVQVRDGLGLITLSTEEAEALVARLSPGTV